MEVKPYSVELRDGKICLHGDLNLPHAAEIWHELDTAAANASGRLDIDVTDVASVDGAIVALLVEIRARLSERRVQSEIVGASGHVSELVELYQGYELPSVGKRRRARGAIERLGDSVRSVVEGAHRMIVFMGETVLGSIGALSHPITGNWRAVVPLLVRAATDAIPLALLLNFLLGFVMGYESSRQLEKYGAEIFVADVVGVAVTRELSPVMTSIIVLGRSAAAYAAELGTMKVSEELDALRTLGLSPLRHLVLPRLTALALATPLLTLLGDVSGVIGGALVGAVQLDVVPQAYLNQLRTALVPGDIAGGLIKASVAGLTIAIIGCQQGFAASGGPAGVGRRTTSTVVKGLVALVLIDTFFAVFLKAIGT